MEVSNYRLRDVDLRHLRWQESDDLRHGRNLQARADADEQVTLVAVVVHEALVECVGQLLAKKRDVRLHYARLAVVHFLLLGARVFAVAFLLRFAALLAL